MFYNKKHLFNKLMKIITAAVNNPIFIEIQYYTLKKYFKGEYEFIVFNDAKDFPDSTNYNDITLKTQIHNICDKLEIKCIDIPNDHHKKNRDTSIRVADSMNYILQFQKNNPDKYLLIDSDMFLIDDFDIDKYSNFDCAIVLQTRNDDKIHYFWNGIYYFDITKMKNLELLNWNCSTNCDTGGMMQKWLKKQNKKNIYFIKSLSSCSWNINELPKNLTKNEKLIDFLKNDIRNVNDKFFCEIYDDVFLHYRCGSNWRNEGFDLHKSLSENLKICLL
jgi:hypothetical protein